MCSLNNAINLYREQADKEDNNTFMIVKKINNIDIPLKDKEDNILYFNNMETADIERIYYQPDHNELLKIIKV